MPYDLYGTYYSSARDAENAEMAQCAAINADIAMREMKSIKNQMLQSEGYKEEIHYMQQHIQSLEERIARLENIINNLQ